MHLVHAHRHTDQPALELPCGHLAQALRQRLGAAIAAEDRPRRRGPLSVASDAPAELDAARESEKESDAEQPRTWVERFDRRGTEPFELFGSKFGPQFCQNLREKKVRIHQKL